MSTAGRGWGAQRPVLGTRLNTSHPLAQGLVGAWLINDIGSPTVRDAATDGELTTTGTTWNSTVNGVGITASTTAKGAVKTATPYFPETSFVCRIQRDSTGNNDQAIAAHHTTEAVASDWFIRYDGAASAMKVDIPWVLGAAVTGAKAIANGQSLTVGMVRSGTTGAWTYKLYYDGIQDGSAATASNPAGNAESIALLTLSISNATYAAIGQVAWAYRYSRALGPTEMLALHVTPFAMWAPPSVARWSTRVAA